MSIHFASLFCTDFDVDLAPHWIRHYLDMGLDSYTVFLNTQKNDYDTLHTIRGYFQDQGVQTLIAYGPFNDGELRINTIQPFAMSLDKNDFLVVADSDEFHEITGREGYLSHDVTAGITIDRYDTTLHDATPETPLNVQYPNEGNVERAVIDSIPRAARAYWPRINKNKICCARAGLPVAFGGSHMLYPDDNGVFPAVDTSPTIKALHYCWRGTILARMAGKHYYDAATLWYVWKFFGGIEGQEPPELLDKIEQEEALQRKKGWEPVYG